jgi:hypothetical protein
MAHFEIPLDIEEVKIEHVEFTPTNEIIMALWYLAGYPIII